MKINLEPVAIVIKAGKSRAGHIYKINGDFYLRIFTPAEMTDYCNFVKLKDIPELTPINSVTDTLYIGEASITIVK